MLLYESLAAQLREQIAAGVLRAGERLPSIRRLALAHGVSAATAVQACLQLEREGLALARPRSGYFVRAQPPAPLSPVPRRRVPRTVSNPALHEVIDMLSRRDLLPLHAAVPAPELLPGTALAAALARALRRNRTQALDYAPAQGHPPLRRLIAQRYAQLATAVSPDEVVITAGAMEAITLALRSIAAPGDVVLVETPTYHGILQAVAALRLKVVELPHRPGGGLDLARLDAVLQDAPVRAAVLVPNFHNPLGSVASDADKQALLARCARHGTVVIEDDVYGELAWSGQRPAPLRHFDCHGLVITCGSFSKTLAPGLRTGWLLGGEWTDALVRAKYHSTVGSPALPQLALADYLQRHDQERHLRRLRRALADNARRLRAGIERHWPQATRCSDPSGGLSLWLQLPPGGDGTALFEAALAEGIGISPGQLFSSRGDYRDHLRLSCGLPWDEHLERALRRLGQLAAAQVA
ncbi:PLP-dependent aminotransferase family protein [Stenotrophomonas sp. MMGLT7]|uniref:aminotransferase-like domain-containing protein n=1 Tax=Stenotrophomonas sp. MMGLT7 TaxID=2901227 RepID=UPI001E52E28A|nr:PLP-dependent aminotransferase family protein [Stenotrophomonas sp. MMGLT7]MCD7097724.1 PLP-dependent aminotransferase family protein [Stenotrophomonas sp. MMGLT7]